MTAVNLGNDADTVGAIYGQLAGAYYGVHAIPQDWKEQCSLSPLIELFADELCQFSKSVTVPEIPIPDSVDWSKVSTPVPHEKRGFIMFNVSITSNGKSYNM